MKTSCFSRNRRNKAVSRHTSQSVLGYLLVFLAAILMLLGNARITSIKVEEQVRQQLGEMTVLVASRMNQLVENSVSYAQNLALIYADRMDGERRPEEILTEILPYSRFQNIEFIDAEGNGIIDTGDRFDERTVADYTNGMNGESGFCILEFVTKDAGVHIAFYAPVRDNTGAVVGVLAACSTREEMEHMMDVSFYGTRSTSFLCTQDGTILGANLNLDDSKTVQEYFVRNELLPESRISEIEDCLRPNSAKSDFSFGTGSGYSSRAAIRPVGNTGLYVLETFPAELFAQTVEQYEEASRTYILIAMAVAMACITVGALVSRNYRKKVQRENMLVSSVLDGMKNLYDAVIYVDLEQDSYRVMDHNDSFTVNEEEGVYSASLSRYDRFYINGNHSTPLGVAVTAESLRAALAQTDTISFEYCYGVGDSRWATGHITCIERRNGAPVHLIMVQIDSSRWHTEQEFMRRLPSLLHGSTYEVTALLDTESGAFHIHSMANPALRKLEGTQISYAQFMQRQTPFVFPEDREEFFRQMELAHVREMMDTVGAQDTVVTIMDYAQKYRTYQMSLRVFHAEKHLVLFVAEDITDRAEYDSMTGLFNEQGFGHRLAEIARANDGKKKLMVLHFNIKGFNALNNTLGVELGDRILNRVGQRLKYCSMHPLAVARLQADQFGMLIYAERLDCQELTRISSGSFEGNELHLTCGIYSFAQMEQSFRSICDKARLAERQVGTGQCATPYFFCTQELVQNYTREQEMLRSLGQAFEQEQFQVYYQPIYDAKTKLIASAEALVRWRHPSGTLVSPGVFIPALEKSGEISRLDLYVAQRVQSFVERRVKAGECCVPVAVNLSRRDILSDRVMNRLLEQLAQTDVDSYYLRYELTESALVELTEEQLSRLAMLRSQGHKLLMDDFGTGYSSLGSLAAHQYDILKMDMSFTKGIGEPATERTIKLIIDYAHNMDMSVVVEGVETEAQYVFLRDAGCDFIQGYYFSKPLPEDLFTSDLRP